jgi:hypothetical protein
MVYQSMTAPDLVKTTELFLVPSSFLVAALGTADTNLHRAAVSLLGLVVSVLWLACAREALSDELTKNAQAAQTTRMQILARFPLIFVVGWLASLVIHLLLSGQNLGKV